MCFWKCPLRQKYPLTKNKKIFLPSSNFYYMIWIGYFDLFSIIDHYEPRCHVNGLPSVLGNKTPLSALLIDFSIDYEKVGEFWTEPVHFCASLWISLPSLIKFRSISEESLIDSRNFLLFKKWHSICTLWSVNHYIMCVNMSLKSSTP